jgi:AcrR family transcriptional regulator
MEPAPKRRRLSADDREREIIEGAIHYFAQAGLQGSMRELAAGLGITHANLFRYFPSKEMLIERVFEEVYLSRWDEAWTEALHAAGRPLRERLIGFYTLYLAAVSTFEWVRIFVIAGLGGATTSQRYLELIRGRVIEPVAAELRALAGLPAVGEKPLSNEELEIVWALHGQLFYVGVRRWVYGMTLPADTRTVVIAVDIFLDGAAAAMQRIALLPPASDPVQA